MINKVRFVFWETVVGVFVVIDILDQCTAFVSFIVWQETADHDRAVAIGMWTLSLTEEVEGVSFSLSGKHVLEMDSRLSYCTVFVGEVWGYGRASRALKNFNKFMAGKRDFSVCVHCSKRFLLLDEKAVYPCCSRFRPECDSDTYSIAPVSGDVAGFQTKVAKRMGKPCFEICLFRCHLCCRFRGLLKSQHPARACFRKHPSPIPIQEAESFL